MNVRLFGRLADPVGPELEVAMEEPCSIGDLRAAIAALYPALAAELGRPSVRACVDNQIVKNSYRIPPSQAVEFLPAVSGG